MEQTLWLPPRGTAFAEVCEACADEHPLEAGAAHAVVRGALRLEDAGGWATCARGHAVRVLRMGAAMPAGALR
ncbi:MAG TPA: hypothetical protein VM290_06885 [Gaiellaceae bacterium]|nr:hypothetical protein [Gaiellaceae bacterium]